MHLNIENLPNNCINRGNQTTIKITPSHHFIPTLTCYNNSFVGCFLQR